MKNPLSKAQRASLVVGRYTESSSPSRPRLQANLAMRSRLNVLLWGMRMEKRHG